VAFRSKLSHLMIRVLLVVGAVALLAMMAIVVANCLGRVFFKAPIFGTVEIAGLAGVVLIAMAIGFTQQKQRNVVVDVVAGRFPLRIRAIADAFTFLLSLGAVALLFWAIFNSALKSLTIQEATVITGVVTAPFRFSWAAGALILCLFLVQHVIKTLIKGVKK
jgi:TRAP-type C4-dicarboxylate transport system permease small subunit